MTPLSKILTKMTNAMALTICGSCDSSCGSTPRSWNRGNAREKFLTANVWKTTSSSAIAGKPRCRVG